MLLLTFHLYSKCVYLLIQGGLFMASVLFILMPKDYQETEFNTPYHDLIEAGHHVDVAGLELGDAIGHQGAHFTPDKQLGFMTSQDFNLYDALVIPGGPGSTKFLWNNQSILEAIKYFHEHKKLVATICYACIPAAQAGILTGHQATVYPTAEAKKIFSELGVEFAQDGCVTLINEKIITAQGPNFASLFSSEILNLLD